MKTALGWLGHLTMGTFFFAGTSGCQTACTEDEETQGTTCIAKSLTRFGGTDFDQQSETAWTSGKDVTVDGVFGKITVEAGSSDSVEVHFAPFSYRKHDGEAEAIRDIEESLKTSITTDASGAFIVRSSREGTHGTSLGTHMIVKLPAGFDAKLIVNNRGDGDVATQGEFDVVVDSVASATALDVRAGSNLGACTISGAPSVTASEAHCGDLVKLFNVSDFVNVSTSSSNVLNAAIELSIAGIAAGSGGGTIEAQDGDVVVTLPTAGVYSVQAQSAADGTVTVSGQPAECTVEEAAATSKTLACGAGGPNYTVKTGLASLGDGSVTLQFQ